MLKKLLIVSVLLLLLGQIKWQSIDNEGFIRDTNLFNNLFTPASASYRPTVIKTIQRGTITTTNGAAGTTSTLSTAVTTANSVLKWVGNKAPASGSNDASLWDTRIDLTNTTTVTAYATGATAIVSFEVVEYYSGVLRSVQRDTLSLNAAGPVNDTISAVTVAKSNVEYLGKITSVTDAISHTFPILELTSTTNVRATYASNIANVTTVGYQVIEWR